MAFQTESKKSLRTEVERLMPLQITKSKPVVGATGPEEADSELAKKWAPSEW